MGVAHLPCNTDYWKNYNTCPYHPIMHEMGMSQYWFEFMWIHFHIYSLDLSDVENNQDDCYVGVNEELEYNAFTGDPIDRNHNQSQNV